MSDRVTVETTAVFECSVCRGTLSLIMDRCSAGVVTFELEPCETCLEKKYEDGKSEGDQEAREEMERRLYDK